MAVAITHSKVVTIPDDGTSPVGSDEWNAGHVVTGLENVDNTSDVNKPVSTAQAAADAVVAANAAAATALKANIASPTFTGVPAAPTAAPGTNTTQLSTTAFVQAAVAALIAGAPGALDTLKELADAINDDASFAATITSALALKAPLASPTFTGNGVTINPTASSTALAISTQQTGAGTVSGTSPTDAGYAYNHIYIPVDSIDASGIINAPTKNGLVLEMYPNGGSKGLVQGIFGSVWIPPSATINTSSVNLVGYTGIAGMARADTSLGGTNTGAGAAGGIFGMNAIAIANTTNLLGTVGMEIDIQTFTGSSMSRRSGITIADQAPSNAQGQQFDAALNITGSGTIVGWRNGVLFSAYSGTQPMDATNGILIATAGAANAKSGVDFSSYTFSTSAFKSTGFNVDGSGNVTGASFNSTSSYRISGVTVLSSVGGATPYTFFLNAAGNNVFIGGGGGGTPDPTNYYQNDLHFFRTAGGAANVGTWDVSGLSAVGAIKSSGATSGVGYATGAGGTVTQATSKATGVTLNKASGAITMNAAALAAGTIVSFVLTDSAIAATDVLILNHISGGTPGSYSLNARCAAGSATIDVRNNTAGSLSEAIVIQFALIKGVNA